MMKRLVILSTLVAILGIATNASERKEAEMKAIASRHLTGVAINGSRSGQQQRVNLLMKDNMLSVYGADNNGFVIVSRDDRFPAVIGYSATAFDTTDMPEGFSWWLKEASLSMQRRIDSNSWVTALTPSEVIVEPLLTTQWSQKEPYNLLCPKMATQRCPTGCVATAAAQVMKFFNYPAQGRGTATYTKMGRTMEAEINSVYDWENMKDKYAESQKTLTDANRAVATLMFEVGAASSMEYTLSYGSSALRYCAKGLGDNFQYDSLALRLLYREYYSETEWNDLVTNELVNEHRPILYAGNPKDGSSGHAFVFDGIDADGLVHVNWGWAGKCDGYFSMNLLQPGAEAEQRGNYSYSNNMLIGITPRETPAEGAEEHSMWIFDPTCELSIDATDSLVLTTGGIYNLDYRYFYGRLLITMDNVNGSDEDSHNIIIYDSEEVDEEDGEAAGPVPFGYGFSLVENEGDKTGSATIVWLKDEELKAGTYIVSLVTQALKEPTPSLLRGPGGVVCQYTLTKGEDGSLTLTAGVPTAISNTFVKQPKNDDAIYNLNGQKVSRTGKGIFIVDSKKIRF
ncbi:MAG: C10 family peptidase [Prevotella sp.]|nr:C10 family peptidase [Prevotella sp.]